MHRGVTPINENYSSHSRIYISIGKQKPNCKYNFINAQKLSCLCYNQCSMRISDVELKKLLIDSGLVKEDVLNDVIAKNQAKEPLQQLVIKKRLLSEKDLTRIYANSIGVPFAEISEIKVPREIMLKIPERIARKYVAVLFGIEEDQYQLAMADPEDFQAADFLTKSVGGNI